MQRIVRQLNASLPITLTQLDDIESWKVLLDSPSMYIQRVFENAILKFPLPCAVPTVCGCCNNLVQADFRATHSVVEPNGGLLLAFSETGICLNCRINSRMRFACDVMRSQFGGMPDFLYMTERKTPLFTKLSQQVADIVGSEFLGSDKVPGQDYDGVMHQDLHKLTFEDDTFPAVLCLDVIEHVNDPVQCVRELHRILRPGGLAVVTFPFFANRSKSVRRSRIAETGEIEHLLPAEFHGNPLGGGSLVFNELSWDYLDDLRSALGDDMTFVHYASLHRAHFGADRFALLLTK